MEKTLCHLTLEYARIEPTASRLAVYKSILVVPQPFRISDIHQHMRLSGKPLSKSTLTNILILFKERKMIRLSGEVKSSGRGRPEALYTLM